MGLAACTLGATPSREITLPLHHARRTCRRRRRGKSPGQGKWQRSRKKKKTSTYLGRCAQLSRQSRETTVGKPCRATACRRNTRCLEVCDDMNRTVGRTSWEQKNVNKKKDELGLAEPKPGGCRSRATCVCGSRGNWIVDNHRRAPGSFSLLFPFLLYTF